MGTFGWSYPPGCTHLPWDEEYPCDVCGNPSDSCICPECPICGANGDPKCYEEHGMIRSEEQVVSMIEYQKAIAEENDNYWRKFEEEERKLEDPDS